MPPLKKSSNKVRLEIAHNAARYIAVDGINDFFLAKRKAAEQMGITNDRYLPSNREVETALQEYQRIYQAQTHTDNLTRLRLIAKSAMQFLQEFKPLLVGPVLTGSATENSEITLHLFCDHAEQVASMLENNSIPFTYTDRKIVPRLHESKQQPALNFLADNSKVVLVIFLIKERGNIPLSSVTGKPMPRATLTRLNELLPDPDAFVSLKAS